MLRGDLKAAGIPYETKGPDGPLFADFHVLRHSYISLMERAGVFTLNDAKELARHSTITLTKDRYTHGDAEGLAKAVDKLDLPGADAKPEKGPDGVQLATALILLQTVLGVLLFPVAPHQVQTPK